MKVGKTTRVLTVYQWKPDPSKKGNVLVKFAMRYTHRIDRILKGYKGILTL